jgi:hypothetical protein
MFSIKINKIAKYGVITLFLEDAKPEAENREEIDAKLKAACWGVQDGKRFSSSAKSTQYKVSNEPRIP